MKKIIIVLIAMGLGACQWNDKPFGYYLGDVRMEDLESDSLNLFNYPTVPVQRPLALYIHTTLFKPEAYRFYKQSIEPADQKQPLLVDVFPHGEYEYKVVFRSEIPTGSAIWVVYKEKHYGAFVGDPRQAVEHILHDPEYTPRGRLNMLLDFNSAYPALRFTTEVVVLETEIENKIFEAAVKSKEPTALQHYLEIYPGGRYVARAYLLLEPFRAFQLENVFRQAASLQQLETYLTEAPFTHEYQVGQILREHHLVSEDQAFATAIKRSGYQRKKALEAYLAQYPQGMNLEEAEEALKEADKSLDVDVFNAANRSGYENKRDGLAQYLADFPYGARRAEARDALAEVSVILDDGAFKRATSKSGRDAFRALNAYLQSYPNGHHRQKAEERLVEVTRTLDDDTFKAALAVKKAPERKKAFEEYLSSFAEGVHRPLAKAHLVVVNEQLDTLAFEEAREKASQRDQRLALQGYLQNHPNGKHGEEASQILSNEIRFEFKK